MKDPLEFNDNNRIPLQEQLLQESIAMAKYAFSSGMKVPGKLAQIIKSLTEVNLSDQNLSTSDFKNKKKSKKKTERSTNLSKNDFSQLVLVHQQLAEIIAPSTPRSIFFMEKEKAKKGVWGFLGVVPLIRRLMLVAILSLVMFIGISLSPDVRAGSGNILQSSGIHLLLNLLFLLSAAGLGASFAALFKVNRYIIEGTFDPKYEFSYWTRFLLGLIAGIILAELIPIEKGGELKGMGRPTLAMLGGFSAAVVYRILIRIIDTIESLVHGTNDGNIKAQKQVVKILADQECVKNRIELASDIIRIRQKLESETNPESLKQDLDELIEELMPKGLKEKRHL